MVDNVIQFPKVYRGKKDPIIEEGIIEVRDEMAFLNHLTEGLIVQMVHNMGENGIYTHSEDFVRDLSFLVEVVKSMMYRDVEIHHPIQDLIEALSTTNLDKHTNQVYSQLDMEMIEKVSEILLEPEDDPDQE